MNTRLLKNFGCICILCYAISGSGTAAQTIVPGHQNFFVSALLGSVTLATTDLTKEQLKEYLETVRPEKTPDSIASDTYEVISELLDRMYDAPTELSPTEIELLNAFIADAEKYFKMVAAGIRPRDTNPESLMATVGTRPATSANSGKSKVKVPGVHVKPTFSSSVRGGIGYVKLSIGGRSKDIIQIRASAGGKDLAKRASMIRDRFREAQNLSGLWWSRLYVVKERGEWVVRSKSYKKVFLVTADENWAKSRKMSTEKLARTVMSEIRQTMDPK